jgi:hypothetical protein
VKGNEKKVIMDLFKSSGPCCCGCGFVPGGTGNNNWNDNHSHRDGIKAGDYDNNDHSASENDCTVC